MNTRNTTAVSHWLPRVLLGIGAFIVWAFVVAAIGLTWGLDGIGVVIVGLLVFCLIGGPVIKWYFERQDRA